MFVPSLRNARHRAVLPVLFIASLLPAGPAWAQVQRSFSDLSFEAPDLQTAGCRVYIAASQVPGWDTTHPSAATENVGGCVVPAGFSQNAPIIEMWRTPRDNGSGGTVNARSGRQVAELNAVVASRIFQRVCLINGEEVEWRFSHRGRGSATVPDVMRFGWGASGNTVVQVGTTNSGVFTAPVVSQGVIDGPLNAPGNNSWVDYRGRFIYGGATGVTGIGFEAIGGTTSGNLLDDIQIELAPFVEFTQSSSSTPEGASNNRPTLRINGTAFSAFTVVVKVTGGTAILGTDYTTPGNSPTMTVNVPAGNYDGTSAASLIALPITVINDTLVESTESVQLEIEPSPTSPASYLRRSSMTCGAAGQIATTYSITDDDSQINVTKNVAAPVQVSGQPTRFDVAYTISVSNPGTLSANYSLVDAPGLDPDVTVLSAGVVRNGGGSTVLSGAGPWTLQPQWRALAGGATDTYVLTMRIEIRRGGSSANDACASPTATGLGLYNAANAILQNSAGNLSFVSDACSSTPTPVWVTLRKRLDGRAVATDQAQVRLLSAGIPVGTATTTGSGLPATATTGVVVVPAGNTMQFEEAIKAGGTGADQAPVNYGTSLACTNATAGSATAMPGGVGSLIGDARRWMEFTPAAGDDLDCLVINTASAADLSVAKTNTPASGPLDLANDTVVSGTTRRYSIAVRNAGPMAANNAVLRDPPTVGMSCAAVSCGATTGGAACPSNPTVAALQSAAGLALPVLPANSGMTFTVDCLME